MQGVPRTTQGQLVSETLSIFRFLSLRTRCARGSALVLFGHLDLRPGKTVVEGAKRRLSHALRSEGPAYGAIFLHQEIPRTPKEAHAWKREGEACGAALEGS